MAGKGKMEVGTQQIVNDCFREGTQTMTCRAQTVW
jgi:hypothetical protein